MQYWASYYHREVGFLLIIYVRIGGSVHACVNMSSIESTYIIGVLLVLALSETWEGDYEWDHDFSAMTITHCHSAPLG